MMGQSIARLLVLGTLLMPLAAGATTQAAPPPSPALSAEQIVERNVAARGGLQAWRGIRTMQWSGHLEGAGAEAGSVRFVLKQARPNRSRFEVDAMGQKSVRIFDGVHGWKMRPSRSIRPDIQTFSPDEVRFAQDAEIIDGPLIDYAAHGSRISLRGLEDEQDRKAWRIDVLRPSGAEESVWIDAETFLDLRYERTSYKPAGGAVKVSVYYHDYRSHDGVQIASVVDVGGGSGTPGSRMVIEQVSLNPTFDGHAFDAPDRMFERRGSNPQARQGATGRSGAAAQPSATPLNPAPASAAAVHDPE